MLTFKHAQGLKRQGAFDDQVRQKGREKTTNVLSAIDLPDADGLPPMSFRARMIPPKGSAKLLADPVHDVAGGGVHSQFAPGAMLFELNVSLPVDHPSHVSKIGRGVWDCDRKASEPASSCRDFSGRECALNRRSGRFQRPGNIGDRQSVLRIETHSFISSLVRVIECACPRLSQLHPGPLEPPAHGSMAHRVLRREFSRCRSSGVLIGKLWCRRSFSVFRHRRCNNV